MVNTLLAVSSTSAHQMVFVERRLRERMERISIHLLAVEALKNQHIPMRIHTLCASVVQVVHILRATTYMHTASLLVYLETQQRIRTNRPLPVAAEIPYEFLKKSSLGVCDGGLGHLSAQAVFILTYVWSMINTAHVVSIFPRQPSVEYMTAPLTNIRNKRYNYPDVVATGSILLTPLMYNTGRNQKKQFQGSAGAEIRTLLGTDRDRC